MRTDHAGPFSSRTMREEDRLRGKRSLLTRKVSRNSSRWNRELWNRVLCLALAVAARPEPNLASVASRRRPTPKKWQRNDVGWPEAVRAVVCVSVVPSRRCIYDAAKLPGIISTAVKAVSRISRVSHQLICGVALCDGFLRSKRGKRIVAAITKLLGAGTRDQNLKSLPFSCLRF